MFYLVHHTRKNRERSASSQNFSSRRKYTTAAMKVFRTAIKQQAKPSANNFLHITQISPYYIDVCFSIYGNHFFDNVFYMFFLFSKVQQTKMKIKSI